MTARKRDKQIVFRTSRELELSLNLLYKQEMKQCNKYLKIV